jgi:Bacterial PH domain
MPRGRPHHPGSAVPTVKVYRSPLRSAVLTLVFLFGAAFFALVAVLASDHAGWVVGGAGVSLVLLLVAARFPFLRVAATTDGLRLHGPVGNRSIPWLAIASISAAQTETDGTLLPVWSPVLTLADGSTVKVAEAGFYRSASAQRVAAELDSLRAMYARQRGS